jgi:hypothetical protein
MNEIQAQQIFNQFYENKEKANLKSPQADELVPAIEDNGENYRVVINCPRAEVARQLIEQLEKNIKFVNRFKWSYDPREIFPISVYAEMLEDSERWRVVIT